jgi:hypothetical protein
LQQSNTKGHGCRAEGNLSPEKRLYGLSDGRSLNMLESQDVAAGKDNISGEPFQYLLQGISRSTYTWILINHSFSISYQKNQAQQNIVFHP